MTKASAPQDSLLRKAQVRCSTTAPVAALHAQLGDSALCLLVLFVTPLTDFDAVVAEAEQLYPDTDVVACTTAGEIGTAGYDEGLIVAVGFPADDFASNVWDLRIAARRWTPALRF